MKWCRTLIKGRKDGANEDELNAMQRFNPIENEEADR